MVKQILMPMLTNQSKTKDAKQFILHLLQTLLSQDAIEKVESPKILFLFFLPVLAVTSSLNRCSKFAKTKTSTTAF